MGYCQMMGLIDFMYKGEVSVAQEDLNNFLVVAEELQIKGLTQNNSDQRNTTMPISSKSKRSNTAHFNSRTSAHQPNQQNLNKVNQSSASENSDDIQEIVPVKKEVYHEETEVDSALVNVDDNYTEYDQDFVQYDEQGNYEGNIVPEDGGKDTIIDALTSVIISKIEAEAGPSVSNTKIKLSRSFIHDEFLSSSIMKGEKEAIMSQCKHCSSILTGKNSTSMKNHMRVKHPAIYQRVQEKDEAAKNELRDGLAAFHNSNTPDTELNLLMEPS